MVEEGKHKELTEQIIKAFYKVYNELGYGFSDIELSKSNRYRGGITIEFWQKTRNKKKSVC